MELGVGRREGDGTFSSKGVPGTMDSQVMNPRTLDSWGGFFQGDGTLGNRIWRTLEPTDSEEADTTHRLDDLSHAMRMIDLLRVESTTAWDDCPGLGKSRDVGIPGTKNWDAGFLVPSDSLGRWNPGTLPLGEKDAGFLRPSEWCGRDRCTTWQRSSKHDLVVVPDGRPLF